MNVSVCIQGVPLKLQWSENTTVDFQVKQEGMWLILPLLNTKLKRNEWERLIILKPRERPESELWVPGRKKKMGKMWQMWQEGVESVTDKREGAAPSPSCSNRNKQGEPRPMQWENVSGLCTRPHKHITHHGAVMLIIMYSFHAMKIGYLTLTVFPP